MEIDDLTDDLLIKILTSLSLKESGRTSILARRWKDLWSFSHRILQFDYTDNSSREDYTINENFRCMVATVLMHHRARNIDGVIIRNFDVDVERWTETAVPAVDSWIKFLMRKKVELVELYLTPESHYTFPRYVARDSSAVCYFRTLRLAHVDIRDSTVEYFLSYCPNLEELSILSSFRTNNIRISRPPNLRVFEVSRCLHMERVVIKDATDLVSLTYEGNKDSLELTNVPNLRHLTLSGDFGLLFVFEPKEEWSHYAAQLVKLVLDFRFLDTEIGLLHASRVRKFCSLKRLELQLYKLQHASLLFVTSLIEASPQLVELKIELSYPLSPSKLNKGKSWFPSVKKVKGLKFVHTKLKEVEMVGFIGCSTEIDFLMEVCKLCPTVDKIVIDTESDYYEHPLPDRPLPHLSACDGCLPEIGATKRDEARRRARKVAKSLRKINCIVI